MFEQGNDYFLTIANKHPFLILSFLPSFFSNNLLIAQYCRTWIASLSFVIPSNVPTFMLMKSNEKSLPVFFCISGGENVSFCGKLILTSTVNGYLELQCKRMIVITYHYDVVKNIPEI